ncbi:Amino acid transporter, transmembrane family-containing protein [Aphelenchoides bicaudatus]|nr:Amino acid transporter, transmembrane family-containing protein [Aphelenchoides bicaudatus]
MAIKKVVHVEEQKPPQFMGKFVHGKIRVADEHSVDGDMVEGEFVKSHGLHWITAALIIVGDMAGGSMIALPTAIQQSGSYLGFILYFLGDSWRILLRHWPHYHHEFTRKPYAEIGEKALGKVSKTIASISVNLSQFGIVVVFFLLSAKNIHDFLLTYTERVPSVCIWILIIWVVVFPLTLLKSPEDFWFLIVASGVCTGLTVVLIITSGFIDFEACYPESKQAEFNVISLFIGLGTIVFAWGGHATFPTIQHDLKKPKDFTKAVVLSFSIVTLFYIIVMVTGTLVYANSLRYSIINSLQTPWIQQTANILIAIHCILSTLIMINPLNLEAEEFFGAPQTFGIQRVLARENRLLETGRDEGVVSFKDMLKYNSKLALVFCISVIVAGVVCGSIATGTSIREIAATNFELPCYLKPFLKESVPQTTASTNCCGMYQNLAELAQKLAEKKSKESIAWINKFASDNSVIKKAAPSKKSVAKKTEPVKKFVAKKTESSKKTTQSIANLEDDQDEDAFEEIEEEQQDLANLYSVEEQTAPKKHGSAMPNKMIAYKDGKMSAAEINRCVNKAIELGEQFEARGRSHLSPVMKHKLALACCTSFKKLCLKTMHLLKNLLEMEPSHQQTIN